MFLLTLLFHFFNFKIYFQEIEHYKADLFYDIILKTFKQYTFIHPILDKGIYIYFIIIFEFHLSKKNIKHNLTNLISNRLLFKSRNEKMKTFNCSITKLTSK